MSQIKDIKTIEIHLEGIFDEDDAQIVNSDWTVTLKDGTVKEYHSIDQESIKDFDEEPVHEYFPDLATFLTELAYDIAGSPLTTLAKRESEDNGGGYLDVKFDSGRIIAVQGKPWRKVVNLPALRIWQQTRVKIR